MRVGFVHTKGVWGGRRGARGGEEGGRRGETGGERSGTDKSLHKC